VGWPGSVADGRVFANSYLRANLDELLGPLPSTPIATKVSPTSETQYDDIPAFILADSAYTSRRHIVPTFKNFECTRNRDIAKLNAKLASIRYCVENAFGICKGRFRLLNRALECAKDDIAKAVYLITAIFILHNFLIDENDNTLIEPEPDAVDEASNNGGNDDDNDLEFGGMPTREILLRHMYWRNYR
jgi:DDE superfamily endonuclease